MIEMQPQETLSAPSPVPDRHAAFPATTEASTDAPPKKQQYVGMDPNQTGIIELLREVHLIAFKEMERLNLRIMELENQNRQPIETLLVKPTINNPPPAKPTSLSKQPEMLTEKQVADHLNVSVSLLRRWRLLRNGPKFVKIGRAVRYKRGDVETWMDSLPGLP
jgi:predicted DNA-binding transcriptional regulator AlpA